MSTEIPTLPAETRDRVGSRFSKRLRDAGRVPAVLYGHGADPAHLHVDLKELTLAVHHGAHLLSLDVAGQAESCLLKALQYDHLGKEIVHVDLTRVDLSEEVEVELEVVLKGEPKALQAEGAVLSHPTTTLNVKCRADAIPESLVVDIDALTGDHPITVADVTPPEGVTIVDDPETLLASITIVQEAPEPEAAEAGGDEPEVIGADKKDDAGEGED